MQYSFFSEDDRLEKLSKLGDSLEKLNKVINWEMFRPLLKKAVVRDNKGIGGRPPYDSVMMFKILVLQRLYDLSDDQTEFQINDRMSFMRFLNLGIADKIPDAKTIWLFKDTLTKSGTMKQLFKLFNGILVNAGLITRAGSIVDATFVDAPKQRNSREENNKIKSGEIPEKWKSEDKKHKLAQKDTDAKWTKKNNETHFGYKDHIKADADSKLIVDYVVTSAEVHDSQTLVELVDEKDKVLYADSAYTGEELLSQLSQNLDKQICEKGYRNQPLTDEQKSNNKIKSKTRVRVEHIFGFMTNTMKGITVRSIGIERAKFNIGLTNLVYNICRYEFLKRNEVVYMG